MVEPAPLVETPDAKAPAGGQAEWFAGAGGTRLRAALFTPKGPARGSIVLSGGRTEVIEKYYEFIGDCLERGFVVLVHDWRGQGLSHHALPDGLKGHASGYRAFLDDFRILLDTYEARLPKPWVAVGHSMGGCLTLLAMAHGENRFASAILNAPMLGVQTGKVSRPMARTLATLNVLFGGAKRYVLNQPGKPFDDTFDGNVLTHDRARFARSCGLIAAEPKLALGAPTWGWLDFAFRATAYLAQPEHLRAVTVPVVIVSAELDKLIDNTAQAAAARNLPQGQLITVPGADHEILMETDPMRNIFLRAFDALTGRVAPKPAEAPKAPEAPKPVQAGASAAVTQAPEPVSIQPEAAPPPKPMPVVEAVKPKPAAKPAAKAAPKAAAPKATAAKAPAAKVTTAKPAAKTATVKAAPKPATVKAPVAKTAAAKTAAKPATAKKPVAAKAPVVAKTSAPAKAATPKAAASKAVKPPVAKAAVAKAPAAKKPAAAKKPPAKA